MLFNSYTYLLLFLPVAAVAFHLMIGPWRLPRRAAFGWLVVMSLIYYGYWNPAYLPLITASCLANYYFGRYLGRHHAPRGKRMLAAGVAANLALLGYYKYTGLFAATLRGIGGWPEHIPSIVLPLGISFFTFQQIAYLVDAYRNETREYHFIDYLLFVTFFPQLIAGPIVHHGEMMPQFTRQRPLSRWNRDFPVGLVFLVVGLFKKVVIADNLAPIASALFGVAEHGDRSLTMAEAWTGAIAYALQIYFDFSGYSDMAIGSARFFGIRLPLNFDSPYQAASIIDFWRRWHMTLSRFLRDYLYIPLGGNRLGPARRYGNLMLTMLLGGLWHGANWTFVAWGGIHGLLLCLNHGWFHFRKARGLRALPGPVAIGLTFAATLVAWVFFRASDFSAASRLLASMFGAEGFGRWPDKALRVAPSNAPIKLIPVLLACWFLPNTQQLMVRFRPALGSPAFRGPRSWWQWRPSLVHSAVIVIMIVIIGLQFDKVSEFIYYQF
ncbi:MBOAT family O-acyltransferase [Haloferula sargassicola]|uniref:Peptidoglycan O-acetyltransferase n=1 Tax=Haloferula sargassicola TaxID=490096 RepID=A0ABP9UK17_9BACT